MKKTKHGTLNLFGCFFYRYVRCTGAGIRVTIGESGLESLRGLGASTAYRLMMSATCWQNVSAANCGRCLDGEPQWRPPAAFHVLLRASAASCPSADGDRRLIRGVGVCDRLTDADAGCLDDWVVERLRRNGDCCGLGVSLPPAERLRGGLVTLVTGGVPATRNTVYDLVHSLRCRYSSRLLVQTLNVTAVTRAFYYWLLSLSGVFGTFWTGPISYSSRRKPRERNNAQRLLLNVYENPDSQRLPKVRMILYRSTERKFTNTYIHRGLPSVNDCATHALRMLREIYIVSSIPTATANFFDRLNGSRY